MLVFVLCDRWQKPIEILKILLSQVDLNQNIENLNRIFLYSYFQRQKDRNSFLWTTEAVDC